MCAVVTVGAVVGPTCGACAARARRWPTAYRRVPKRCAPKSWGLLCTKIINREIFACFAPRKQVRVCKFHSFVGVFLLFIVHSSAKTRHPGLSSREQRQASLANMGCDSAQRSDCSGPVRKNDCTRRDGAAVFCARPPFSHTINKRKSTLPDE